MAVRFGVCAALLVAALLGSLAPKADAIVNLARAALDSRIDGPTTLDEVNLGGPLGILVRSRIGLEQFNSVPEACRSSTYGLLTFCLSQYTYLVQEFGTPGLGRLFAPGLTEDMLTPEFLAGIPAPTRRCCKNAVAFQSNFCACEKNVILAFRNFGYFDPSLTMPFANHLYGKQCGAPTFLADDCPNGNPFEQLGRKLRTLT